MNKQEQLAEQILFKSLEKEYGTSDFTLLDVIPSDKSLKAVMAAIVQTINHPNENSYNTLNEKIRATKELATHILKDKKRYLSYPDIPDYLRKVVIYEDALAAIVEAMGVQQESDDKIEWDIKGEGYQVRFNGEDFAFCETPEHAEYICKCIKSFEAPAKAAEAMPTNEAIELLKALLSGKTVYRPKMVLGEEVRLELLCERDEEGNPYFYQCGYGSAYGPAHDRILEIIKHPSQWRIEGQAARRSYG